MLFFQLHGEAASHHGEHTGAEGKAIAHAQAEGQGKQPHAQNNLPLVDGSRGRPTTWPAVKIK